MRIVINGKLFEEEQRVDCEDIRPCTEFLHNGVNIFQLEVLETLSDSKSAGIDFALMVKGKKKLKLQLHPNKKANSATTVEGRFEITGLSGPSAKSQNKKLSTAETKRAEQIAANAP